MITLRQQTLATSFTLEGVGIHTGEAGRIRVHPAAVNSGRVFRMGETLIPAKVENVVDTTRCTTLAYGNTTISTVEHILSALAGLNIDNALIEVEGREIPILDGSSFPFVEAILSVGIQTQDEPARFVTLQNTASLTNGNSEMSAAPNETYRIEARTDFDDWKEGDATLIIEMSPEEYVARIAPARTFAFRKEVEMLLAAGLAKGGSLDNALIVDPPDTFSTPLRVPSEWCAHKILDIVGDLALLDARPSMAVSCRRPGHRMNYGLAKEIRQSCKK